MIPFSHKGDALLSGCCARGLLPAPGQKYFRPARAPGLGQTNEALNRLAHLPCATWGLGRRHWTAMAVHVHGNQSRMWKRWRLHSFMRIPILWNPDAGGAQNMPQAWLAPVDMRLQVQCIAQPSLFSQVHEPKATAMCRCRSITVYPSTYIS